jgi:lipoate-protein ligase A
MQHGSILLAQSPHTPDLPGVAELTGCSLTPEAVAGALVTALAQTTGFHIEPGEWLASDEQVLRELVESRYTTAAWNERR